jgi:hypothetical protein
MSSARLAAVTMPSGSFRSPRARTRDAIDTETGAFLMRTNGRGKGGLPKFVLIKPNKSVEERGGLFTPYDWDDKNRKFIRAWTLREAIEIGNKRLERM